MTPPVKPKARGFAAMPKDLQRTIAAKGGKAIKAEDRAFSKDPELAKSAGTKGGKLTPSHLRSFSQDRALASSAGRKGGSTKKTALSNVPLDEDDYPLPEE